ncbi:hypothetical protein SARC_11207 [Sphaeroforma arctica JP610]|uniref:Vacuolar ATPase assembly protein VMA22 n=1 Tax=Sphaeroforma arctica JP610 TaxID=667725 RepID=A0A0L0FJS6_9EUKA|nr:hypothetical protein SARC_11207 [Sphaeroforma arctica JP610]KNC76283.1 hypothetical protein SARC_11207 [Sphaeroforma arctica JP610]|eukprot:XP_014150185.1 hypothetical protein SARC_11207 [Sphaeroforma arctica JP610]
MKQRKNKNTPQRSSTDNSNESGDTQTDEKSIDAQEDGENEPEHPPTTQRQSGVNKSGVNKADPIRWFGLLVPAPLRTAQKDFRTAIELSLTMVGLKNGIEDDIKQIETLKVALTASDE